jgi:methylglutaconyl-CoA hydratase
MKSFQTILLNLEFDTCTILLNIPEKGNAINLQLIREINDVFKDLENDNQIRFVVIKSAAKNFCTGADLEWMSHASALTPKENLLECIELAEMFSSIYHSSKIVLTEINGACIGGGVGFAAASDICIASETSFFSFSEVRLGLVPAIISPYVINRVGTNKAKEIMLTGEKLSPEKALQIRLINQVCNVDEIDSAKNKLIDELRYGEPAAQKLIKITLNNLNHISIDSKQIKRTANILASLRILPESKKRIDDILNRRK